METTLKTEEITTRVCADESDRGKRKTLMVQGKEEAVPEEARGAGIQCTDVGWP